MCSGKTSVARALAKKIQMPFWDIDSLIEKEENKSISEIFSHYGEKYFRTLETKALKTYLAQEGIFSTGGGSIILPENREMLRKDSVIIYLKTGVSSLESRATKDEKSSRPLLAHQSLAAMLMVRDPLYKNLCDYTVTTDDLSLDEVVDEVLKCLE